MGIPVMILGNSGSGKSTSLRNFDENEVGIFNVASKPLPFRKKLTKLDGATYEQITASLGMNKKRRYVIDDSQYLMAFEFFNKATETGYAKFTNMALNFQRLIDFIIKQTTSDTIVYFLHHTEISDGGRIKAKTIGKMLDEKLTIEGLFTIVLLANTDGQRYYFETQSNGYSTVKSPMEMFDREIDNDLKKVDTIIREYYEIK